MKMNHFCRTLFIAVMFLGGIFSGGQYAYSQTPSKVVVNINGDPSTRMGFNWVTTTTSNTGKVEIVQGITDNFTSGVKTVDNITPTTFSSTSERVYKAVATGLSPATTYSFRVGDGSNWSDVGSFTTAPGNKSDFSFLYTTDPQGSNDANFILSGQTLQAAFDQSYPNVKFWICCGDHTDYGNANEWNWYFNRLKDYHLKLPYAPVRGNHEGMGNTASFQNYFNTDVTDDVNGSQYSFVYGDVLFMALNYENGKTSTGNWDWMRAQVAKYPDTRWRIAFLHKAVYTGSMHHGENEGAAPIFDELEIDLALQGHDHIYEVIGPVYDRNLVAGAISGRTSNSVSKTGYAGGIYNVDHGTLYFLNNTCGNKTTYTPNNMGATSTVPNYLSLFTGYVAQPGLPTFSNISVTNDEITISTYTVSTSGSTTLLDEIKVVKSSASSSDDAELKSLTVSAGTLTPLFSSGTTNYTVNVANNVTSINLTATPRNSNATVTGDGTKSLPSVGDNTFSITVTAEDHTTTKTYTVNVVRAQPPSTNANLSNLTVSSGTLTPAFDVNTLSYTVTAPASVSTITITATKADANATVTGDGTKSLAVGDNTFPVQVTAEDGTTTKTYTITVKRLSNNTLLQSLTVAGQTLSPAFSSGVFAYTVQVPWNVTNITVSATAADPVNSTVTGDGSKPLPMGDNIFSITVTAEDNSTQTYTLTVRRQNNDADLKLLTVNEETLIPVFAPGTLSYNVDVVNTVSGITISAEANDAKASVTGSGAKTLSVGVNTFTVTVTSEDQTEVKTYTITVNRAQPPSSNADLSVLKVLSGAENLLQDFTAGITIYNVDVPFSVTNVTVEATTAESTSSYQINGNSGLLSLGDNIITVEVTSENGTEKTYTITVVRQNNDAALKSLTVNKGTLTPVFAPGIFSYTVDVANAITDITISAEATDAKASVTGTGIKSLIVGVNTFTVEVTSEDQTDVKTYTITVNRAQPPSSNADLSVLKVLSGTENLLQGFTAGKTTYDVDVPFSVTNVTVEATPADANATVKGTGNYTLTLGVSTTISVVVTAESGTPKMYRITVNRAQSLNSNADLYDLNVSEGELSPEFNPNETSYSVNVTNNVKNITVSAIAEDANAGVTGTVINHPLDPGINTIVVKVTAEDGSTKTYTVTVNRQNNDADLSALKVLYGEVNLLEDFIANNTNYTVNVPNNVEIISVTATPADVNASVTGTVTNQSLDVGVNTFTVTVKSEDQTVTKEYTITVERAEPDISNADLSALTVSEGSLSPAFSTGITEYTVHVINSIESISVSATAADVNATIATGTGTHPLDVGSGNVIHVVVNAQNGNSKTYTIVVTREIPLSNDASLKSIHVDNEPAVLKTGDDDLWEIEVDFTVSITIFATANHPSAIISDNCLGMKSVQVGLNVFEIVTRAEDGTTKKHNLHVTVKTLLSKDEMIIGQPLVAYPNPASEIITIGGLEGHGTLTVFDAAGRQCIRRNISSSQETIDVNALPRGYYIVQIIEGTHVRTIKIIVN